jgi:hypothetical protein
MDRVCWSIPASLPSVTTLRRMGAACETGVGLGICSALSATRVAINLLYISQTRGTRDSTDFTNKIQLLSCMHAMQSHLSSLHAHFLATYMQ